MDDFIPAAHFNNIPIPSTNGNIPMAEQYYSELENRRLIKIGGGEAQDFLQGILTCNVESIPPGGAGFCGLLSPQGKILFDFFALRDGENFLLDVNVDQVDDLVRRLTFYRLRADVTIDICGDELQTFAVWGGNVPKHGSAIIVTDPRARDMGWRIYSSAPPTGTKYTDQAKYHSHRIELGMPEGGVDYSYGKAFPHEALYDQIGGVDFAKGCYVGQEVISRVHHRATARKRVIQLTSKNNLPESGTKITAMGKTVGEIGSTSGIIGMANMRLDHVKNAISAGEAIMAGDVVLEAHIQSWVKFGWPGE
jgi:folate-binding protein YgfZ